MVETAKIVEDVEEMNHFQIRNLQFEILSSVLCPLSSVVCPLSSVLRPPISDPCPQAVAQGRARCYLYELD